MRSACTNDLQLNTGNVSDSAYKCLQSLGTPHGADIEQSQVFPFSTISELFAWTIWHCGVAHNGHGLVTSASKSSGKTLRSNNDVGSPAQYTVECRRQSGALKIVVHWFRQQIASCRPYEV